MLFTIAISVVLSVIITLNIIYFGILWYAKRLEARTKENMKEVNALLEKMASQANSDDYIMFTYPDLTDTKQ